MALSKKSKKSLLGDALILSKNRSGLLFLKKHYNLGFEKISSSKYDSKTNTFILSSNRRESTPEYLFEILSMAYGAIQEQNFPKIFNYLKNAINHPSGYLEELTSEYVATKSLRGFVRGDNFNIVKKILKDYYHEKEPIKIGNYFTIKMANALEKKFKEDRLIINSVYTSMENQKTDKGMGKIAGNLLRPYLFEILDN